MTFILAVLVIITQNAQTAAAARRSVQVSLFGLSSMWLTHPGASVDIEFEVFVNRFTAPQLNSGLQQIEDILVLHLDRGKDYFISVMGNYLPSCFGTSIQALCHLREAIQEMPLDTIQKLVSAGGQGQSWVSIKFARELFLRACTQGPRHWFYWLTHTHMSQTCVHTRHRCLWQLHLVPSSSSAILR